jgi:hypothetical protein
LSEIVDYFIIIYFNDIFIYFKLREDYYAYIKIVIKRLKKYKLYIKLNKYVFNVEEVEFLEFIINIIKVKSDFNKIFIIEKWFKPESFYEV